MSAEPELFPLRVCNACNTSDTIILDHLRSCMARGLPAFTHATVTKEKPLVILGSGPSGPAALEALLESDLEFDLMALNGAYNVALGMGLVPTYYAMLDARAVNVNFLEDPRKETRFLICSQCHPDIFERLRDNDVTVFHMNTPSARDTVPPPAIFFGGNAGTVGTTAMGLACELGYRHLILLGYDSSLTSDGKSHSRYQPQNADQALMEVDLDGRKYWTTPAMADQVMTFFQWTNILHDSYEGLEIRGNGEGLFYDWIQNNQNNATCTTEAEAAKYVEAYKDPNYKMSAHRRAMIRDIIGLTPGKSLLDVGTGRGETLREAEEQRRRFKGTETVPALLNDDVVYALLPSLPFADGEYEIVTCFEVLEHLLPHDLIPSLQELKRVASKWVIVSVCTSPDYVGGVNLHPSAMPEQDWMLTFSQAFGHDVVPEFCGNASTLGVSPIYRFRVGE